MNIQQLKIDLIHWLTELEDESILSKIQAIRAADEYVLTKEQEREIERRLERYEQGKENFYSWEEAQAVIRKRSTDAV